MEKLCLQFHCIIIELADNKSRYRIYDKFEFGQDQSFMLELLAIECPKNPIFIIVSGSVFIFIQIIMKLVSK